jgi:tRNA threonylcarbamoyladenosine biosynthesis protein TsaE
MSIFDQLREGITTRDPTATRAIAAEFARALPPGTVLALHGDLGVGKTTFVQGLASGLGITAPVTSPTFNLFTLHRGTVNLVHLDAYRLGSAREFEALLVDEFLSPPWIFAVEWPERIAEAIPPDALHLELRIQPDQNHHLLLRRAAAAKQATQA